MHDFFNHHRMKAASLFHPRPHAGIIAEFVCDSIWHISHQNLDLLKELRDRRLINAGHVVMWLLLSAREQRCHGITERFDLTPHRLFPWVGLRVAPNKLEHKSGDRVLFVWGILELRKRASRRFFECHPKSDAQNAIIRRNFALCNARLVKDPRSIDTMRRQ